jgi:ATP-dependent RNA helicase SUPV3L1/SUV3
VADAATAAGGQPHAEQQRPADAAAPAEKPRHGAGHRDRGRERGEREFDRNRQRQGRHRDDRRDDKRRPGPAIHSAAPPKKGGVDPDSPFAQLGALRDALAKQAREKNPS